VDNKKMDLKETGFLMWIQLDSEQWHAFMNKNFLKGGEFLD
jgi:hypothetical protein